MTDILGNFFELLALTSAWRIYLQDIWTIALLIACFIWGGGPEKASIAIWMVVFTVAGVYRDYLNSTVPQSPDFLDDIFLPSFVPEVVVLIGYVALALVANRQYVFWLAAWQIIAVMGHVVRGLDDAISPFAYVLMYAGPGWMQIWIMTGALIIHMRREKNRYADWRWQVATRSKVKSNQALEEEGERANLVSARLNWAAAAGAFTDVVPRKPRMR